MNDGKKILSVFNFKSHSVEWIQSTGNRHYIKTSAIDSDVSSSDWCWIEQDPLSFKFHITCITSMNVIAWVKGERISSERVRERSDGPKSSLTGCTNTSRGAPPYNSLPRQTIVQSLAQHWVDKRERKKEQVWLGGLGEPTVIRLLSTHPTHSWNYGPRAAVAVCSPGAPASTTPLCSHCLPATS